MKLFIALLCLMPAAAFADIPSTHGMLLFGKEKIYISHLPMFHSPHDYQAIAEIELAPAALKAYQQSVVAHPSDTVYTLVPEMFSLPEMMQHPRPFTAELFHGHFERGGELIASSITVRIKKVLFFRKFLPQEKREGDSYLLFGTATEAFVAHYIVAKPDFDQIISASAPLTGAEIARPLESNGILRAQSTAELGGLTVRLNRELYLETSDLAR